MAFVGMTFHFTDSFCRCPIPIEEKKNEEWFWSDSNEGYKIHCKRCNVSVVVPKSANVKFDGKNESGRKLPEDERSWSLAVLRSFGIPEEWAANGTEDLLAEAVLRVAGERREREARLSQKKPLILVKG